MKCYVNATLVLNGLKQKRSPDFANLSVFAGGPSIRRVWLLSNVGLSVRGLDIQSIHHVGFEHQ